MQEIESGIDHLPASVVNFQVKAVDSDIKAKERLLALAEQQANEFKDRITVMHEHLLNVQQELVHTQQLLDSKQREIETEVHLKQLSEREAGKIAQEVVQTEKEMLEVQDALNIVQNNIFRGNERLDQFKMQLNWNQEELEQWTLAAKQKEEDNKALQKYAHADEQKIKELVLAGEKINMEVQRKKIDLENEVTETQASQIELDKTAEEFRKLHRERQEFVRQWEQAIEAIKNRDAAIQQAGELLVAEKVRLAEKIESLKEKKEFLTAETTNNREIETQITAAERVQHKYRAELQRVNEAMRELEDELEVVKNTLAKCAQDLGRRRADVTSHKADLAKKKASLEKARKKQLEIKAHAENEYLKTDDLETKAKQIDDIFLQEEQNQKQVDRELSLLKEDMFRESQELFRLRQSEANLIAEISGAQTADKNLRLKIHTLDSESMKQQELIYNADFSIQALERKVSRASGQRSADEKKVLNARIEELTAQLEEQANQATLLTHQLKRLHDDMRATTRRLADLSAQEAKLQEKISELHLTNETIGRDLKSQVKLKEETIVAHDLLRLECKKLRDILNEKADQVYNLENRKFQLQMSMEERAAQIQEHRDLLRAELKLAEDARHRAVTELREKQLKVETLEKKYEVIVERLPLEDGQDTRNTPAYYVVKRAQEREMLQREGDALDAKIRKAEREIQALESTLDKVSSRNAQYRTSFHRADLGGKDYEEKQELERKLDRSVDKRKAKKTEMESLEEDVASMRARLGNLLQEKASMFKQLDAMRSRQTQLEKELGDQAQKKDRAFRQMTRLSQDVRKKAGTADETAEEADFRLQELRETTKGLLIALVNVSKENPELRMIVEAKLREADIKPPSRPVSRPGSERALSERSGSGDSIGSSRSSVSIASNVTAASRRSGGAGRPPTGGSRPPTGGSGFSGLG